jgi:iron complex transport system permease protein
LAFVCGIGSVIIVWSLAQIVRADKTLSLILAGVLVSGMMSSILGWIKYTANQETQLPNIVYWIMGDLSSVTMKQITGIMLPALVCITVIMLNRRKLNYFAYSDCEAISMGINIALSRVIFIVCATVLVSLAISISGSIGWVGLVIPQLARSISGTNNRDTVPIALVLGANFLLLMDIINRLISAAELPISILTGLIGTPLFVTCLVIKQKREMRDIG